MTNTETETETMTTRPALTAGNIVIPDGRLAQGRTFETLTACEDWDGAAFRLASGPLNVELAVNVRVTGRVVRRDVSGLSGTPVVRVEIEFVDEDAPSTFVKGWAIAAGWDRDFRLVQAGEAA